MATVEQFIMQMQMQGLDKVDAAQATFQKFEAQLKNEQAALEALKAKFADAGSGIGAFAARLDEAKSRLNDLKTGKEAFDPKAYADASNNIAKFSDQLDNAKSKAAGAQAKIQSAINVKTDGIKALDDASKRINGTGEAAAATQGTFAKMKEAMAGADGATGKFSAALKALPPQAQAVVAAVTATIAVLTAAIAVLVSWTSTAIASAQGRDALLATFNALGQGRGAGAGALAITEKLGRELPFTTAKINTWARSLLQSGVANKDLESAIRSTANATALMGEEGGASVLEFKKQLAQSKFAAMAFVATIKMGGPEAAAKLATMGLRAADLAKQLGVTPQAMKGMAISAAQMGTALDKALRVKGAAALENLGLTWEVIKGKFDEGVGSIFSGMGDAVRPFMQAIKDLFGEFNKGTPGINAAKNGMTSFLTLVFTWGAKAVVSLHKGFLMLEIAAFQVAIAMLPIVRWIMAIASNATFLNGLVLVLKAIGIAVLVVGAAMAVVIGLSLIVAASFAALAGAIVYAVLYAVSAVVEFFTYIDSLGPAMKAAIVGWASAAYKGASEFVTGIVSAITFGKGPVADAVKALASSALSSFTSFFKIKSPSRVMMQMGGYVAEGAAVGIEEGAGGVSDAAENMAASGQSGAAKGFSRGGAKASGGGDTYNITVEYSGKREDNPDLESWLLGVFERARNQGPRMVPT